MPSLKAWVKIPPGLIKRGRKRKCFKRESLNVSHEQISQIDLKLLLSILKPKSNFSGQGL